MSSYKENEIRMVKEIYKRRNNPKSLNKQIKRLIEKLIHEAIIYSVEVTELRLGTRDINYKYISEKVRYYGDIHRVFRMEGERNPADIFYTADLLGNLKLCVSVWREIRKLMTEENSHELLMTNFSIIRIRQ